MSRSAAGGLNGYLAVLSIPQIRPLLGAAFVGRLPIAMTSLALVLLVSDATGSYATAGVVAGVFALASGIAAPIQGRLIDRHGQTRVLVPCAVAFPVAIATIVVLAEQWPRPAALVACAAVCGAAFPPLFATLRALLTEVAGPPGLTEAAFAMEAILQEVFFILGPLLVALLVAVASPQVALVAAAALASGGTLAFASTAISRRCRTPTLLPGRRGALVSPGIRTLAVASVADGLTFGVLEVAMPAFAQQESTPGAAGVLLAALGVGSMAGGLWYGARTWSREPGTLLVAFVVLLGVALLPLALAGSLAVMLAMLLVAGFFIAPGAAVSFALVGKLTPDGAVTEAFTWLTAAVIVGFAAGGAAGGLLVELAGTSEALLAAAACALSSGAIVFARRGTLRA